MKRPKRLSKVEGVVSHIAKPDIDNLLKSVMETRRGPLLGPLLGRRIRQEHRLRLIQG